MRHKWVALATLAFAVSAQAQRRGPLLVLPPVAAKVSSPAPRLAERLGMVPAAVLPSSALTAPEEITGIGDWNAHGGKPSRNGFRRALPDTIDVHIEPIMAKTVGTALGRGVVTVTDHATVVWSTVVKVEKAYRLRLHLENVKLPLGAVLWVYGSGEAPTSFGTEMVDDKGTLWTPSVGGEVAYLEVEVPASSVGTSFSIREVLEIVVSPHSNSAAPNSAPPCLIDATCIGPATFDYIDNARKAVAQLQFITAGSGFVCSGSLIVGGTTASPAVYLLTANHCFSDQGTASSLEAFWDYRSSFCNGPAPAFSSLPRSSGAVIRASSASSDFTLLSLNNLPPGRGALGWDADFSRAQSSTLHHLSFPLPETVSDPLPIQYSDSVFTTSNQCTILPRPQFVYSAMGLGGTTPGSSGSPAIIAGGYVVGQLYGTCGPTLLDCDRNDSTVDGAFASTYDLIKQFIDPTATTCVGPQITSQPQSQTIQLGQTATISLSASGTAPLLYTWYAGFTGDTSRPFAGLNTPIITWSPNVTSSTWSRVSNDCGSATSVTATLTVQAPPSACTAPTLVETPQNDTVKAGQHALLHVSALGTAPLHYAWHNLADALTSLGDDSAVFQTPPLLITTQFNVTVSNACGSVDSPAATITVKSKHRGARH